MTVYKVGCLIQNFHYQGLQMRKNVAAMEWITGVNKSTIP